MISQKTVFYFLLFITIAHILFAVYIYRSDIFLKFNAHYWADKYNRSQWADAWSDQPIGDDGLYTYAGYAYVNGKDPSLLNAETPPLGKYFIGFFETVTGYWGVFSLFFGCLSLIALYFLNTRLFENKLTALVPVAVFSFDPIFTQQLRAPFLDTMYLTFLLFCFYFFLKKNYLVSGAFAGAFMATKSPFQIVLLLAAFVIFLFVQKKKLIKPLGSIAIATVVIYILSYTRLFLLGRNPIYFLKVQKYILAFYGSGAKGVPGAVFPMLTLGYWQTWFAGNGYIVEWTPLWTISLLLSILAIILVIRKRNYKDSMLLIVVWFILYLGFLTVIPIFPRYLLLLLPFGYNLSVWVLSKSTALKFSRQL
ncbi:MAG TPA: glycosyltransferase family 39 protein [Candidatus Saccharimonadales bacterium]|nr:glycosyltransferase family 39 protein [Candidatus Saccharimonadales bacterium]